VAAWNSYWHMVALAVRAHQDPALAYSLPGSVDGMLLVATLAMAEDKAQGRTPRGWARFAFWLGACVSIAANVASVVVSHGPDPLSIAVSAWPPVALLVVVEIMARPGRAITAAVPAVVPASTAVAEVPALVTELAAPAPVVTLDKPEPIAAQPLTVAATSDDTDDDVVDLLPVARAARDTLTDQGTPLTRDTLAAQLRRDGYPMRNARVSALLRTLRSDSIPSEEAMVTTG
jgi:hypothetical protein